MCMHMIRPVKTSCQVEQLNEHELSHHMVAQFSVKLGYPLLQ